MFFYILKCIKSSGDIVAWKTECAFEIVERYRFFHFKLSYSVSCILFPTPLFNFFLGMSRQWILIQHGMIIIYSSQSFNPYRFVFINTRLYYLKVISLESLVIRSIFHVIEELSVGCSLKIFFLNIKTVFTSQMDE